MSVFTPGDRITLTVDGVPVAGVIEDFTYDITALMSGLPGDTANIRTDTGILRVLCADLATVTS